MDFPITTYRSQALMNHLSLPSVLIDLIKNFVFFNTSTFYRIMQQPMEQKETICSIIRDGHSRAQMDAPEDRRLAYVHLREIWPATKLSQWSFKINMRLYSRYIQSHYSIYRYHGFEISAENCGYCGNYLESNTFSGTEHKLSCHCKFVVDSLGDRYFGLVNYREMPKQPELYQEDTEYSESEYDESEYDSESEYEEYGAKPGDRLDFQREYPGDSPPEPVAVDYGPAILPPPRRRVAGRL